MHKNIFIYLLSATTIIILSCHGQIILMWLCFKRCLSHHQAMQTIMLGIFTENIWTYNHVHNILRLNT